MTDKEVIDWMVNNNRGSVRYYEPKGYKSIKKYVNEYVDALKNEGVKRRYFKSFSVKELGYRYLKWYEHVSSQLNMELVNTKQEMNPNMLCKVFLHKKTKKGDEYIPDPANYAYPTKRERTIVNDLLRIGFLGTTRQYEWGKPHHYLTKRGRDYIQACEYDDTEKERNLMIELARKVMKHEKNKN